MSQTMFYRQGSEIAFQGVQLDTLTVDGDEPPAGWFILHKLFDADGKWIGAEREQSAAEIIEGIPGLSLADLSALLDTETARDKPRKGVLAAIEKAMG